MHGGGAEFLQPDALAVEHAENVMVRPDKEFRRIGKRLVTGVPARVGMAMGGQDGKAADAVIEPPRQRASLVIGREQPILVQQRRGLSSEERRLRTECGSTCRSRWSQYH